MIFGCYASNPPKFINPIKLQIGLLVDKIKKPTVSPRWADSLQLILPS